MYTLVKRNCLRFTCPIRGSTVAKDGKKLLYLTSSIEREIFHLRFYHTLEYCGLLLEGGLRPINYRVNWS
jgi:hypothetical protein